MKAVYVEVKNKTTGIDGICLYYVDEKNKYIESQGIYIAAKITDKNYLGYKVLTPCGYMKNTDCGVYKTFPEMKKYWEAK